MEHWITVQALVDDRQRGFKQEAEQARLLKQIKPSDGSRWYLVLLDKIGSFLITTGERLQCRFHIDAVVE